MAFKIYTKTGDKGQTSLIGGDRVPKHHVRIEAYGTVDELNSWIGLLRDETSVDFVKNRLGEIQNELFVYGSYFATPSSNVKFKLPEIHPELIKSLEADIDLMDSELIPLKQFILPGGTPIVSHIHIARCVCRRAERLVVSLSELDEVPASSIEFLNRLSDYLFTFARYSSHKLGVAEIPWKP